MDDIQSNIQARRAVEDRALQLADERRGLDSQITANTQAIIGLIPEAAKAGIPFEQLAGLIGVSRQTLYRWREIAGRLEMAAKRTKDGHFLHQ